MHIVSQVEVCWPADRNIWGPAPGLLFRQERSAAPRQIRAMQADPRAWKPRRRGALPGLGAVDLPAAALNTGHHGFAPWWCCLNQPAAGVFRLAERAAGLVADFAAAADDEEPLNKARGLSRALA